MSSIYLLTRLQVQQSLGGIRAAIEKRAGANGAMAGTLIICALLLGGVAYLGYMLFGMVGGAGIDKTVYDMLFLVCGALTFVFSLPSVLGSFFGSSDINDLLPLPVTPTSIVFSKALGALTTSYLWTLLFIAGPLLGWGIAAGASVGYWIAYVLAVIFTPFMPVSYAGTISILIATVFKRIRRKDAITTITTVLTLAMSVGMYFVVNKLNLGSGLAQSLGTMGDSMGSVVMAFPAYGFAVFALAQTDPLGQAMFVLLSVVAFAVFVLVARVLYMRIVTSLSSGAGKADAYDGSSLQSQTPVFWGLVRTEVKKIVRSSSILLNYVVYPLVISPVLIVVMMSTGSSKEIFSKLGEMADVDGIVAGFALIALILLAALCCVSNRLCGTAVSREGTNWIHMKFVPVPMRTQLLAKLLPGYVIDVLICLVYVGVPGLLLVTQTHMSALIVASGLVLMLGCAWLMCCVAIAAESRNPKVDWGKDEDVNVKVLRGTGADLRAALVGVVYAALPVLVTPFVRLDPHLFMPIIAVVGVVVAVVLGRVFLAKAARNIESFE